MADFDVITGAVAAMSAGLIAVANEIRARQRARQADVERAAGALMLEKKHEEIVDATIERLGGGQLDLAELARAMEAARDLLAEERLRAARET